MLRILAFLLTATALTGCSLLFPEGTDDDDDIIDDVFLDMPTLCAEVERLAELRTAEHRFDPLADETMDFMGFPERSRYGFLESQNYDREDSVANLASNIGFDIPFHTVGMDCWFSNEGWALELYDEGYQGAYYETGLLEVTVTYGDLQDEGLLDAWRAFHASQWDGNSLEQHCDAYGCEVITNTLDDSRARAFYGFPPNADGSSSFVFHYSAWGPEVTGGTEKFMLVDVRYREVIGYTGTQRFRFGQTGPAADLVDAIIIAVSEVAGMAVSI
jgi:hypothetical protein